MSPEMLQQFTLRLDPYVVHQLRHGFAPANIAIDGEPLTVADVRLEIVPTWREAGAQLRLFWVRFPMPSLMDIDAIPPTRRRSFLLLVPSDSDGRGHPGMSGKFLGYLPGIDLLVWYHS